MPACIHTRLTFEELLSVEGEVVAMQGLQQEVVTLVPAGIHTRLTFEELLSVEGEVVAMQGLQQEVVTLVPAGIHTRRVTVTRLTFEELFSVEGEVVAMQGLQQEVVTLVPAGRCAVSHTLHAGHALEERCLPLKPYLGIERGQRTVTVDLKT